MTHRTLRAHRRGIATLGTAALAALTIGASALVGAQATVAAEAPVAGQTAVVTAPAGPATTVTGAAVTAVAQPAPVAQTTSDAAAPASSASTSQATKTSSTTATKSGTTKSGTTKSGAAKSAKAAAPATSSTTTKSSTTTTKTSTSTTTATTDRPVTTGRQAGDTQIAGASTSYGDTATPVSQTGFTSLPDTASTFSLAVLPDTQNEMYGSNPTFVNRAKWLASQAKSLDLRQVIHTGDIVSWDTADHVQYKKAKEGFDVLNAAGIPWTASPGNHDTGAVCPGGSACPGADTHANLRDTTSFNTYFSAQTLTGYYQAGRAENAYRIFEAEGVQWMTMNMEFMPRKAVVDWANQVIAANPRANVILSTHMFIDGRGNIGTGNDGYGDMSPKYVWDNLVTQHPNVKLVLNGHTGSAAVKVGTTNAGTKVVMLNGTFHDSVNVTRLLTVDTAQNTVRTRFFTPDTNLFLPLHDKTFTGMDFIR